MSKIYFTLILLILTIGAFGADISKSTYVFDVKGKDTLRLDKYEVKTDTAKKPCVLFVFGGGFIRGKRDYKNYIAYFNQLAQSGYVVVSIDYRLGLKSTSNDFKEGKKVGAREIVKRLKNAIDMAVEDLYSATNFVIKQADEWHIDKKNIVISGSSAGAITVLQAEYYLHSDENALVKQLPDNFDYAGVISFAGAIFSTSGNLKWTSNPAPIQFFHGDADRNVPYNKAKFLSVGFFGSKNLSEKLDGMKSPYQFIDFYNMDHSIAEIPMKENIPDILTFLKEWVIQRKFSTEHILIKDFSLPEAKKDFSIADYIRANFS